MKCLLVLFGSLCCSLTVFRAKLMVFVLISVDSAGSGQCLSSLGFFGGVPQLMLAGPYMYTYFYMVCSAVYYVPLTGLVPRCTCGLTGVVGT